jgi:fermentation-respiration switch protein FrsA (DUF1100 family)
MPISYLLEWKPSDLSDIRFFEKPATLPYFRPMLKAALITLLILTLLALASTWYLATHVLPYAIIQPGNKSGSKTPADFGLAYEHLRLQATDSIELDAFYIPSTTTPKANLVILHGVGSCKEVYLGTAERLCAMGYNLYLLDQRAHGKSGGKFLTYGYHEKEDISKVLDWLETKSPGIKIGIYGNSMGAAIALQSIAHDGRLTFGLIESTFTDLPSVAHAYGQRLSGISLPAFLTNYVLRQSGKLADFDPWTVRPIETVTKITVPIQFIHGDADQNINVSNGHALYAACASADKALYIVKGGDHADLWDKGGKAYEAAWFGFLGRMVSE